MTYHKVGRGENLLTQTSDSEIYILASGRLRLSRYPVEEVYKEKEDLDQERTDMLSYKMDTRVIEPPEVLGDLTCLEKSPWLGLYAYGAEEENEVIVISKEKLRALYSKTTSQKGHQAKITLLEKAIPLFKQRLTSIKNKLAALFEEKEF